MSIELFRPMLAEHTPSFKKAKKVGRLPTHEELVKDLEKLDWKQGFWCSPKMDGIRAIKHPTKGLLSRTLKPIPNKYTQRLLNFPHFNNFDGELMVHRGGGWGDFLEYNPIQSAIMSQEGEPNFLYCVFDDITLAGDPYGLRNWSAQRRIEEGLLDSPGIRVHYVPQYQVKSIDELFKLEEELLTDGFEGLIMRHPGVSYKNGRSTFLQQGMIKLKRFEDAEAVIEEFEELLINNNEVTTDARGYQVRSAHKDNKLPAGTTGKLICRIITGEYEGTQIRIGSGLDDSLRFRIWQNRDSYVGQIVKFKYQPHGTKDVPRSPIFLGFRSELDL